MKQNAQTLIIEDESTKRKNSRPCYGYLHYSESRDLKSSFMDVSFQSYLKI